MLKYNMEAGFCQVNLFLFFFAQINLSCSLIKSMNNYFIHDVIHNLTKLFVFKFLSPL